METLRVYRWHITRKLINPSLDSDTAGKVDVNVTPAREDFPTNYFKKPIHTLYELPQDDLGFWENDDEFMLEGWTTEPLLLQALLHRNLIADASRIKVSEEDRRIVEDMVLLQVVEDVDAFTQIWKAAQEVRDLPDISGLVELKGARWTDFTSQARKLTKDIYNRVLAVMRERGDAK